MPLYEFRCVNEHRFERLLAFGSDSPPCPACGQSSEKRQSSVALVGRASTGRSLSMMPQTWRSTHGGDREYVTNLRHEAERRVTFEGRNPELAGETRHVLAHEGKYAHAPLYEGESLASTHVPAHHHEHSTNTGEKS
jgi:putative FmdB family regulatory protein